MRKLITLTLLCLLAHSPAPAQRTRRHRTPHRTPQVGVGGPQVPFAPCDNTLWDHVYNPGRLEVVDPAHPCVTATGTVMAVKVEKDGDAHIQVRLDPGQDYLLNYYNRHRQGGNLVVEPICVFPLKRVKCRGIHQSITSPNVGDHVRVTGIHVRDANHYWKEIHPVTSITVL